MEIKTSAFYDCSINSFWQIFLQNFLIWYLHKSFIWTSLCKNKGCYIYDSNFLQKSLTEIIKKIVTACIPLFWLNFDWQLINHIPPSKEFCHRIFLFWYVVSIKRLWKNCFRVCKNTFSIKSYSTICIPSPLIKKLRSVFD